MTTLSRRKFFALAAGAAAAHALPTPVLGMGVEPAEDWDNPALLVGADLPPARFPKVGDMIFCSRGGIYVLPATGYTFKLSSDIAVEQLVITHLPASVDRTRG